MMDGGGMALNFLAGVEVLIEKPVNSLLVMLILRIWDGMLEESAASMLLE